MPAVPRSRLVARARGTNWRALLAWALIVGATTAGLYFGVSERVTREIVKGRGAPCVRLSNGLPSAGCRRIARLVVEECRRRPKLCLPLVRLVVVSPQGRRLVRAELRRALRARASRERRRAARRRPGGSVPPASTGTGPTPPPPQPTTPPASSGPPASPPPRAPAPAPPGLPLPPAARDPVGAVNDLGCRIGLPCPTVPAIPPLPALPPLP